MLTFHPDKRVIVFFPYSECQLLYFENQKLKSFITLGNIFQSEDKKAMKDVDISVVSVTMAVRCRGGR